MVEVAKNLRLIEDMALRLEARAIDRAGDREIPGGDALVNLASVGSMETWQRRLDLAERQAAEDDEDWGTNASLDTSHEDPDELWPAVQMLWFWSEDIRTQLGHDYDDPRWRPTLISEARFLRNHDVAEYIWNNEPHWDEYAADVAKAKTKLEAVLIEGTRVAFRGVECLYDSCGGARLIRKTVPTRGEDGEKAWRLTDWFCPKCKRSWSEGEYTRRIYANVEATHWAVIAEETWCTMDRAARSVARPEGTVRSWVSRGQVTAACLLDDRLGRPTMVMLEDVRERDRLARERHARWLSARKRAEQITAV